MFRLFGGQTARIAQHLDPSAYVKYAKVAGKDAEGKEFEATEILPSGLGRLCLNELKQAAEETKQKFQYWLKEVKQEPTTSNNNNNSM